MSAPCHRAHSCLDISQVQRALLQGNFVVRGRGLVGLATGSVISSVLALLIVVNPLGLLDWRTYVYGTHKPKATESANLPLPSLASPPPMQANDGDDDRTGNGGDSRQSTGDSATAASTLAAR